MMFIAHGLTYFLGYLRAPSLVHYYSIYIYVTFLCSYSKMVLLITLMIVPHTQQVPEFTTSSDLEQASNIFSKWFQENYLKTNLDKYHVLFSETSKTHLIVKYVPIASSCCEKLLGIKIDHKLSFEPHVESLCKKASQKLNALARMASSLKFKQRKLLLNAFITSQFSYAPVVWMFHSRKLNNRINHIHERVIRLVYKDYTSSFDELLFKDNSFRIHHRNLQKLAIEIFKVGYST